MDWSEIVEQVLPYHGLNDPEVELPAILDAFGRTGAQRFLEIGTYQGGTSAAVALGYPDAEVYTIDLPQPEKAIVNAQPERLQGLAFKTLCPERVTQVYMDSSELSVLALPTPLIVSDFDMVFVDGDHRPEPTRLDLQNAATLLTPTGAILVHDYTDDSDPEPRPHWTRWVQEAVTLFVDEHRFVVERLPGWLALLWPGRSLLPEGTKEPGESLP